MFKFKSKPAPNLPPGTPVYVGDTAPQRSAISITYIARDPIQSEAFADFAAALQCLTTLKEPIWINVEGLANISDIEKLCQHFAIHPLIIEDIVNTHQRSKIDRFNDYLFLVVKGRDLANPHKKVDMAQLSLLLKENVLLTFQEHHSDVFNHVTQHLKSRCTQQSLTLDYVAYSMLDALVDDYLLIIREQAHIIEEMEEKIIQGNNNISLTQLYDVKRANMQLGKALRPMRDIFHSLFRDEHSLIQKSTYVYYRDLYDHCLRLLETIETYHDTTISILDIYLSSVNNKMNETMRILTMFSSIFIPLTFITGIYGMNFTHMPELSSPHGYGVVWSVILVTAGIMLIIFKRKGWW